MRSAPWRRARQRSMSMDCESVERVANAFSKVPFQPTFFLHPLAGSTMLQRDTSSSGDYRSSRRLRNLRSVMVHNVVRIELVVDAGAQEFAVVAEMKGACGRPPRRRGGNDRDLSQTEVEVFDLGGPIAGQTAFDPAADRQARLGVVTADDGVDRLAIAVEPEDRAGGHHFAHRQAAGDVSKGIRRRADPAPAAPSGKPLAPSTPRH